MGSSECPTKNAYNYSNLSVLSQALFSVLRALARPQSATNLRNLRFPCAARDAVSPDFPRAGAGPDGLTRRGGGRSRWHGNG